MSQFEAQSFVMSEVFPSDLCALISLSNFFAIPRPFHPPRKNLASARKNLASATAGALAYQKNTYILFQNFGNPRAFPPPPRKNLASATAVAPARQKIANIFSPIFAIFRPFHPPHKNFANATAGSPACQKIAYILFPTFCNPPALHPPSKNSASATGRHLRVKKLRTFFLQFLQSFGLSSERYRGGTCVSENCLYLVSKILTILQPFHPPRKNLASATAGAPACQKIACILFPTFLQSRGPSTHPVKIWRALPWGHLRVRKLHAFFQNFDNARAFPPPPRRNLASATAGALAF